MSALILMDVDGVLNPALTRRRDTSEPVLSLTPGRARLLSEAAALGELVWATSHGWDQTAGLEAQAGITTRRPRIPLAALTSADLEARTPKLRRIIRWIDRARSDPGTGPESIIWIDDVHGPDAHTWARTAGFPVLLLTPDPAQGLTPNHLGEITAWINQMRSSH